MTGTSFAATHPSGTSRANSSPTPTEYRAGICNIGPAEVARRRRAGHIGLVTTALVFVGLVAIGSPTFLRFLLVLPAAAGTSGYLQAWLKFCAGFGSLGVFNFGAVGETQTVADADARRRDRRRANQIGLASLVVSVVVAFAAFLAPP
jgi:hypothetical protein